MNYLIAVQQLGQYERAPGFKVKKFFTAKYFDPQEMEAAKKYAELIWLRYEKPVRVFFQDKEIVTFGRVN